MINKKKRKIDILKKTDRESIIMILFAIKLLTSYFFDGTLVFITITDSMKLFSLAMDAVIYFSIFIFICMEKYTKKEVIIIVAGYLLTLVTGLTTREIGLPLLWTWLILIKTVSYNKWIRVSLYCHCIGISIGIIATITGIYQNDAYGRSVLGTRYTFGLNQPNYTGNILFLIATSYCWLKKEKLNKKDYLILAVITAVIYIFMNSQGTTIVMLVFIVTVFLFQNVIQNEKARRTGLLLLFYMSMAFAILAVILSVINVANIPLLAQMDKIISYRYTDAYRTLKVFGFSLFGQKMDFEELNTYIRLNGGRAYYMDCMWIYIFSHYGIVFSVVYLYLYFSSMYRFVKKEKTMTVIIYFCAALYAMEQRIGPYLFSWVYTIFLTERLFQRNLVDFDIAQGALEEER